MTAKDIFLTPIFILLVIAIANRYRNKYQDPNLRKYFRNGLYLKIAGAIFFGLIYTYYYYGGDSKEFFEGAEMIRFLVKLYPAATLKFVFSPFILTENECYYLIHNYSYIFRGTSSLTIIKITSAISFITFFSYFATSVIFAALSFTGLWKLYLTFYKAFPQYHKEFAIAIFYVPSVVFWGSGISKDSVTIGAIGWMVYAFFNFFYYREKRLSSALIMIAMFVLLSQIRGFIIVFLLFSMGLVPFVSFKNRIKNSFMRTVATPALFFIALVIGLFLTNFLGNRLETYSLDSFMQKAQDFQKWHGYLQQNFGGSGYSLGNYDNSLAGMIKVFIPAVNVTLFRPYFWEAGSVVILISAIESFVIFIFTLRIIFKYKIINIFNIIFNEPLILFSFTFSILYAFAAGFTSYNFGALVRYKIPCLPFYIITLYLLSYYSNKEKKTQQKGLINK